MATGPVNRALLESGYQNAGDIYSDLNTEFCFDVIADQIDDNAVIFEADGSSHIPSAPITGVTGTNVYDQMAFMETQIAAIIGNSIPPGSISTAMIQDNAVTFAKLEQMLQTAAVGGQIYAYRNLKGGF